MKIIVGYTGFVGSNLLQFYDFDMFFNSKNFENAKYLEVDEIFFCGIPAVKWYANKYPEEDFKTIDKIKEILKTIKTKKFILISTIDVYEDSKCKYNEDYECIVNLNNTYGRNRYLFELFIKSTFDNYNIIRLPALFGNGLKKNIIYDLLNNNLVENISLNTKFQWYDLNWLKDDIDKIIENNIKICNLFTEPLETFEIINLFNYPIEIFNKKSNIIYDITTKYSKIFDSDDNMYIRNKKEVLHNIKNFVNFSLINRDDLVVSNICVKYISQFQFANILKLYGIKNVQIAPTKLISNWENLNEFDKTIFYENNLQIYSLQSITFGLLHNIFDNTSNTLLTTHIKKVIDFSKINNIKVLVFGCPKNRYINDIYDIDNKLNYDEIFCDFFNELGDYIGENELKICIENNSKKYNCNYINTIVEAGNIVRKINNKNIKLMIDIGNAIMENDNIELLSNYSDILYNIDISQENMINFSKPNHCNTKFKYILDKMNYPYKKNLEMILNDLTPQMELENLKKSLNNFIKLYGK